MKDTKRRLFRFSLYDRTGIAEYLVNQAKNGWMIEKIDNYGFKFRKTEPKKLSFAITYLPEFSEFTPLPNDGQIKLFEFCEHTGWKNVKSTLQLQVFYNESENPIPLETDALVELETIHKAGKKSFLLTGYLFVFVSVLQLFSTVLKPFNIYSITYTILWSMLLIAHSLELIRYYKWRKKALKNAEIDGSFTPSKSNLIFKNILTVFLIIALLFMLVSAAFEFGSLIVINIILGVLLLLLSVSGVLYISGVMRSSGISENTNRAITITLIIFATIITITITTVLGILFLII